jgi:hypothetical protein
VLGSLTPHPYSVSKSAVASIDAPLLLGSIDAALLKVHDAEAEGEGSPVAMGALKVFFATGVAFALALPFSVIVMAGRTAGAAIDNEVLEARKGKIVPFGFNFARAPF